MDYRSKIKKLSCLALGAVLAVSAFAFSGSELSTKAVTAMSDSAQEGNTMDGLEFTKDMKIGWNLGNTFDAPSGETSWGNPETTPELLQLVKDLGFNTIRIPISWRLHTSGAPDYVIDEKFMTRVDTVVNQALDAGLYVIINSHHDNEIYYPTPDNCETGKQYLAAIWTQIGEHFKDADYHLIFQTMNEPRVVGTSYEWAVNSNNKASMAAVGVVNELNQTALDAMRATGGKNADRFVIISPYAGNSGAALMGSFKLPQDSAEGKLIVSIHAYTPYNLALSINSKETEFKKSMASEMKSFMKSANYLYIKKGIPVVIDEMGCLDKSNPEARYEWAKTYVSIATSYGIPCIWWDNGALGSTGENFGLINRRKLEVYAQSRSVYEGLMDGLTAEAE